MRSRSRLRDGVLVVLSALGLCGSSELCGSFEARIRGLAFGTYDDPDRLDIDGPQDWTMACKLWSGYDPAIYDGDSFFVAELPAGSLVHGHGEQQLVHLRAVCLPHDVLPDVQEAGLLVRGFAPDLPPEFHFVPDADTVTVTETDGEATGVASKDQPGLHISVVGYSGAGDNDRVDVIITDRAAVVTSTILSGPQPSDGTGRDLVSAAVSTDFGVPPAKVVVDGPVVLSANCSLWTATNPSGGSSVPVVIPPGWNALVGRGQDQLSSVATQCFLVNDEMPTSDEAAMWVEWFTPGLPDGFSPLTTPDAVVVEPQVDGFTVTIQGEDATGKPHLVVGNATSTDVSVTVN